MIHPIILSGGSGTRLWPMSRTLFPKQLLSLLGGESLLQQTVRRVSERACFAAPLLLEPIGRNTAPAACIAALALTEAEPDPLMLVMASDHRISETNAFLAAV